MSGTEQKQPPFEAWGIVELMGHQSCAGRLTEQVIAGANLLRVDIPLPGDDREAFRTVYYGSSAIYALNITDEAAARAYAGTRGTRPSYAWELERTSRLAAPRRDPQDDFDGDPE